MKSVSRLGWIVVEKRAVNSFRYYGGFKEKSLKVYRHDRTKTKTLYMVEIMRRTPYMVVYLDET